MADTGPPWNLRFPGPQDFVRETNFYIEDLAEDTAAGLSAAGGLVAVKQALKTDVESLGSVAAGAVVDVTGLSITHAMADENNRLILSCSIGMIQGSTRGAGVFQFVAGTTPILVGDASDSRSRRTAAAHIDAGQQNFVGGPLSSSGIYAPNTTDEITYKIQVGHSDAAAFSMFVNRRDADGNATSTPRTVSSFVLMEVKV